MKGMEARIVLFLRPLREVRSPNFFMSHIGSFFASNVDYRANVFPVGGGLEGRGQAEHLLHSLPYYLAITRSSCEVSLPIIT